METDSEQTADTNKTSESAETAAQESSADAKEQVASRSQGQSVAMSAPVICLASYVLLTVFYRGLLLHMLSDYRQTR